MMLDPTLRGDITYYLLNSWGIPIYAAKIGDLSNVPEKIDLKKIDLDETNKDITNYLQHEHTDVLNKSMKGECNQKQIHKYVENRVLNTKEQIHSSYLLDILGITNNMKLKGGRCGEFLPFLNRVFQ